MKKLLGLLLIVFLIMSSCMKPMDSQEEALPEDIAELKNLRKEKLESIRMLEKQLAQIDSRIIALDPNAVKPATLVTAEALEKRKLEHFVTLQGSIVAKDLLGASSETGGRILQLFVQEGQYVRKGTKIAKIDLEVINKQIAEIEKSLELANDLFEKQSRLWEQKIGSEIQYLQAKNNKERLEKTIENLRYQLTKSNIYAPISGVVERVFAKTGEMANPGAPIVQILDNRKIKAVVDVPENYLRSVRKGEKVELYYPAIDMEEQGRISDIGRVIDPSNRTFKIEINIKDATGFVKPNLLVEMKLNDFTIEDAIVIPLFLVQEEVGGKKFVFMAEQTDKGLVAKKVYVSVGEESEGEVVITEGLTSSEEIIVDGAFSITDGELIQIQENNGSDAE